MKVTGIVRKMDDLGRITVPIELRRAFEMKEDTSIEILADDKGIFIRKYEPACIFCGSIEEVKVFENKKICKRCIERFKK